MPACHQATRTGKVWLQSHLGLRDESEPSGKVPQAPCIRKHLLVYGMHSSVVWRREPARSAMSTSGKSKTSAIDSNDRQARLAAELRANLLKRKAFARAQAGEKQNLGNGGQPIGTQPEDKAD